jgi:hypothetical protein
MRAAAGLSGVFFASASFAGFQRRRAPEMPVAAYERRGWLFQRRRYRLL